MIDRPAATVDRARPPESCRWIPRNDSLPNELLQYPRFRIWLREDDGSGIWRVHVRSRGLAWPAESTATASPFRPCSHFPDNLAERVAHSSVPMAAIATALLRDVRSERVDRRAS